MIRVRALLAIRENYTWQGVRVVLKARVPLYVALNYTKRGLSRKPGEYTVRTWWLLLVDPKAVLAWQGGLAEGVFI